MIRLDRSLLQGKTVLLLCSVLLFSSAVLETHVPAGASPAGPIHLWFGGDVHFGNAIENPLLPLRAITNNGIGIINLEGPVHEPANTHYANKVLKLYNAPRTLPFLQAINVKIASIANNHQNDAGIRGRQETEQGLQKMGVLPVGGSSRSTYYTAGDYRLIIASYDLSVMLPAGLTDELTKLAGTGDLLIILFHVSGRSGYLPDARLRSAVDAAVRAGARIIVSHGSHVVGPVERRHGSIIAWGLGNLAFNCACTEEYEAIILQVSIDPANRKAPITSACVVPIEAGLQGRASVPARDGPAVLDLLQAIGSDRLDRKKGKACF